MKKINSSGFVMAETLIVTVFLTAIFAMLYSTFLPLAGEYEKRENYDNVDGKYAVYWIKRIIEDASYNIPDSKNNDIRQKGYVRFECSDIVDDEEKRTFCVNMVHDLQVANCDKDGNRCDVFITKYRLDNPTDTSRTWFKKAVKSDIKKYEDACRNDACCIGDACDSARMTSCLNWTAATGTATEEETQKCKYINSCLIGNLGNIDDATQKDKEVCIERAEEKVFRSGFKDYVFYLPDYTAESLNYANYRVIAIFHNKKDNNNNYSYATIEVSR